jgi:uncharacterized damage-inducible protein DinB
MDTTPDTTGSARAPAGDWLDAADDPREVAGGPPRGERELLAHHLRRCRLTIRLKCEGLDAEQLARRSLPPSSMSLLGLVRHLAVVEHHWFRRVLGGEVHLGWLYDREDDWDWNGAVSDPEVVVEAFASWDTEVAHADQVLNGCSLSDVVDHGGGQMEVRAVLLHVIEEYARHAGHADLLREQIDGRVGE